MPWGSDLPLCAASEPTDGAPSTLYGLAMRAEKEGEVESGVAPHVGDLYVVSWDFMSSSVPIDRPSALRRAEKRPAEPGK